MKAVERPIFVPKNRRPLRDEQWDMKQAVIERDGITDCFWCRTPFLSPDDATLEHIKPLADGGMHDLRNCTLSCKACNEQNQPRTLVKHQFQIHLDKAVRTAVNRISNGGSAEHFDETEDCDLEIVKRFPAIARHLGRPMKFSEATYLLRNIYRQTGRNPPDKHQRHIFKAHFNRWITTEPTL